MNISALTPNEYKKQLLFLPFFLVVIMFAVGLLYIARAVNWLFVKPIVEIEEVIIYD